MTEKNSTYNEGVQDKHEERTEAEANVSASGVPEVSAASETDGDALAQGTDTDKRVPLSIYDRLAMLSMIVALVAWIALAFDGVVALIVATLAFVAACFGLKGARRLSRNVAITSIVASSVLMVVVGAFLIVIYIGLSAV